MLKTVASSVLLVIMYFLHGNAVAAVYEWRISSSFYCSLFMVHFFLSIFCCRSFSCFEITDFVKRVPFTK